MKPSFFVTGTDTNVGKTVAATVLAAGLGAHYWKPIQTGSEHDAEFAGRYLGRDRVIPEGFRFPAPLAPAEAARLAGKQIFLSELDLPRGLGPLVVEGAGGALVPLSNEELMIDLMQRLGLPVVVVARTALGTINHTLLTLEALRARALKVAGVLFVGEASPANEQAICRHGAVASLGTIPPCPEFTARWFRTVFANLRIPEKENL